MRILLLLAFLLSPLTHADNLMDRLPSLGGDTQPTFLPPDQAFGFEASVKDDHTVLGSFKVTPTYYLYRDKISIIIKKGNVKLRNLKLPTGDLKNDPNFGEMMVFHQSFQAEITLVNNSTTAQTVTLEANYQGCSENGLCYPPQTKDVTLKLPAPVAAPAAAETTDAKPAAAEAAVKTESTAPAAATAAAPQSESSQIAQVFKQKSFWLVVSFFFGAGLLMAFTPCVFPMIPILSGIIVGHGHKITKMHGFLLSLAYVLGMALTYAAMGVTAGMSGSLLSNALQTPAVLFSFAAIFVVLSLSMFGFYELQLPSSLQSKLTGATNQLHGGHLTGVFVMGALSAVIVSPCVAAPMAGALLYIGQTHDALLGGSALFAMAIGMGVPLLLVGASAGALLPRAGAWMEAVKSVFGVMMLGVAIWLVSSLLPVTVVMLLWAALLIMSAVYLHALDPLPHNHSGWHKMGKGIGFILLLLGVSLLIGALSGARDIMRPLGALGGGQAVAETGHLQFQRIKNLAELDQRVAQARGKTVMVDFYADWCVACKEFENNTFNDPKVQALLKNTVLLQFDLTANNADDKASLQRYQLFGPPGILFFNREGKELADHRVVGYQDAEQFMSTLKAALK
jgi:thioredoxin:protein disulfide reductase